MLNRRTFLKGSALALAVGLGMPALFRRAVASAKETGPSSTSNKRQVLIVVQLKGGNDGLNSVVPYGNGHYYDLRKAISAAEERVIPLDKELGFHPSLEAVKPFWDSGKLAVIEGVGYPFPNYSHFTSMDYWETANTNGRGKDGWLGRYLDELDAATIGWVPAMNIGSNLAPEMRSRKTSVSTVESLDNYQFKHDRRFKEMEAVRFDALEALYETGPGKIPEQDFFDRTFRAALSSSLAVQEAHASYKPLAEYPDTRLARDLLLLAEAVHFNQDLKVGHVKIGGFDTHANQIEEHSNLLLQFSEAIAAFMSDVGAHGHGDEVLVMTWSEFGRRPASNASAGTDHGSASSMFVLGEAVKGGLYGDRASLTDLDKGNLKFTTDFRSVYATVLERWLKSPADDILAGSFERLTFLGVD